jgi:predicted butyrate kinase (DUF1464 family)
MTLSLGVEYNTEYWKTCFMEDGQTLELQLFSDAASVLAYIEQVCLMYPEPVITVSSPVGTKLLPIGITAVQEALDHVSREYGELRTFLEAIQPVNFKVYSAPSVPHASSIPRHRKLNRREMGDSPTLCSVAALLYRMREQEASWTEMRFLYLEIDKYKRNIVVIKDGQIIDGLSNSVPVDGSLAQSEDEDVLEDAFWEGLTQDLAGLMALHHFEDVVVMERGGANGDASHSRKSQIIERLNDTYQLYHFPLREFEREGFEAAIGAAIIAEGL